MLRILLASKSPRRQELLRQLGFEFQVAEIEMDESYPKHLSYRSIPVYLADKKMLAAKKMAKENQLIIGADTIVWDGKKIIGKPVKREEGIEMLSNLSGKKHEVLTGVVMAKGDKVLKFTEITRVFFRELSMDEIVSYIDNYKPYDKAGGYAIQEWIGLIGIYKIQGDFYNVVGFPTVRIYEGIKHFEKNLYS